MPRAARLAALLLALAPVASTAAQAPTPRTWQGTVGARRVVLETWRDGADAPRLRGRWFDRAIGVDHALDGRWQGDTLRLDETDAFVTEDDLPAPPERPVTLVARWRLVRTGDGLAGVRAPVRGARDTVRLATVARASAARRDPADSAFLGDTWLPWRGHEAYEALRAEAPLADGAVTRRGPVAWRTRSDPRSGAAVPRLVAHPDPARMARANAALDALLRHVIASSYACAADLASRGFEGARTTARPDTTNRFTYAVVHADARLLTLGITGSVFCGGAHPSNVTTHRMLDLATGRRVTGGDLVRPGRRGALERLVRTRLDRRTASAGGTEDDCPLFVAGDDGAPTASEQLGYAIVDGRFTVVQDGHPHALSVCDGRYGTLPRALLRDIVHPWVLGSLSR